jgi:chorismate mutase
MKVFMSWSGARSKATAELLAWWTRCVIQASRPWISTEDIDRGALWFSEINNGLNETAIGIVCLTHENKNNPWILFEAGALAKGLSNSRVCTFLVDLEPKNIQDPLAQFNHTMPTEADMRKLVRTLNSGLGANALEDHILADAFKTYWPQFKERFDELIKDIPQVGTVVERPAGDILGEILENVRGMNQRIRNLEASELSPQPADSIAARFAERQNAANFIAKMKQSYNEGHSLDGFLIEAETLGLDRQIFYKIAREIMDEAHAKANATGGKRLKIRRELTG